MSLLSKEAHYHSGKLPYKMEEAVRLELTSRLPPTWQFSRLLAYQLAYASLVTPVGIEPNATALKGRCPDH